MYIVDFVKKMVRKSNVWVLIYLVMNILLIGYLLNRWFDMTFGVAQLTGIVLYVISLSIALSPVGEWILRLQTGCRKIKRAEQKEFLEPIFREMYAKAKQLDNDIPDDVELFINGDENPNAFATGRKTICVTEGLLHMPEEQIKATLGHEFGHLAHKDTDMILVVTVGNFIVTAIITLIKIILIGIEFLCSSFLGDLATIVTTICSMLFVDGAMWVWTKIGTALVMKSSRENEFEADAFAFQLGYGSSLCALLDSIDHSGTKGLFATLESTHPDKDDRIARLQEMGVNYRKSAYLKSEPEQKNNTTENLKAAMVGFQSQEQNAEGYRFCPNCGKNVGNAKFCVQCGTKMQE